MPVIFDEVIGTIEPPAKPGPPAAGRAPQLPREAGSEQLGRELRRLAQRQARLRAD